MNRIATLYFEIIYNTYILNPTFQELQPSVVTKESGVK